MTSCTPLYPISPPHNIRHRLPVQNHLLTSFMAPYDFSSPDADVILRSSDGKELRVHRLILSLSSPVFQSMFSLPQSAEPAPEIPTIDVPESSDILQPFLQYLYPRSPPTISDLTTWADLYTIADKYNAEATTELLRDMLIPRFLETSPLRVYALASHFGFEEETRIASRGTLKIDISKGLPEEDVELMGSVACQKLYLLHIQRRDKARALVSGSVYQFSGVRCSCPPVVFQAFIQTLSQRVSTTPWLTAEGLYEAAEMSSSKTCDGYRGCRNSFGNIHAWFSSILEMVSKLPQTI